MARYSFKDVEKEVFDRWQKEKIYEKAKKKNEGNKKFYFLQGPPYTSGKIHIGTAWNNCMKDAQLRYLRMKGLDVWDRAGYDMHGLPTAHKVMANLGIKNKEEIATFGVEKFINECKKLCVKNMKVMNDDLKKMAVWLDFSNPYQSITNDFIDGEWFLAKQAHEKGRLYEGKKTMTWCAHCGTALAKHELEYENVKDDSIYLKFPLKNKENEYLIIWTTTPWTIPFNLAVMVNPELDYVKIQAGDEVWYFASVLANTFMSAVADKPDFKVLETIKGKDMEGWEYIPPFYEELKKDYDEIKSKAPKTHTVLMSTEYVDASAGSGLVHTAPGCGPEDYEVGHANGIPPYNTLDESGVFPKGEFAGMIAKKDDKKFVEMLKEKGSLIASVPVEHDYPFCWRCHEPVVFRTTKQWFFKVEDLKGKMIELNNKVNWVPDWAGNKQFNSWLENLRDNSITRQRYWGTPVPIWKCEKCGKYDVIGSLAELKEKAGKIPEDPHKPWIDEIKYKCDCGGEKVRIPDIFDVWVDAGTTSWNCLFYPERKDLFEKLFPADFILEGKDQIRGWFNILLVTGLLALDEHPYKSVYMHGFVNDSMGRKMSKSLGNYILPAEVIDKYGADTMRYYMIGSTNPGEDMKYNFEDMDIRFRNLNVLWNVHNYLKMLIDSTGLTPSGVDYSKLDLEEKFILSRMHSTIKTVTEKYDNYLINEVPDLIESLYLDLSRTYIQQIRSKFDEGDDSDKQKIINVISEILFNVLKMFSTVSPFVSEKMYLDLKDIFGAEEESIALFDWPKSDERFIDEELENQMDSAGKIMQAILHARQKMNRGVRWPVKKAIIVHPKLSFLGSAKILQNIIKEQTNVKEIEFLEDFDEIKEHVDINKGQVGKDYGSFMPRIIEEFEKADTQEVLDKIDETNFFPIKIDDKVFEINQHHLEIEKDVPDKYVYVDEGKLSVYLDKEMDENLETEGFVREIIRQVQQMRKKAGLEKTDNINLFLDVEVEMSDRIEPFFSDIKLKTGSADLFVNQQADVDLREEKTIKKEKFVFGIKKI